MNSTARAGLIVGVALAVAALTATSAEAASEVTEYSCTFRVDDATGEGTGTASFDTGVPDGLVVEEGAEVFIDPISATITPPAELVTLLREQGASHVPYQYSMGIFFRSNNVVVGGHRDIFENATAFTVPADGDLTIEVKGGWFIEINRGNEPGRYELVGQEFTLSFQADGGVSGGLRCEPSGGEGPVIDAFEVTAAATPSTSATATPVRPALVQTDFADEDSPTAPPLLALGGLAAASVSAFALGRASRRGASRRH